MDTKESLFGPPPPPVATLDMDRILSVVERTTIPAAARVELLVALGMTRTGAKAVMAAMGPEETEEKAETPPPAPVINVPAPQVTVVPATAPEVNVHIPPRDPINCRITVERDGDGKMTGATLVDGA